VYINREESLAPTCGINKCVLQVVLYILCSGC